MYLNCGTLARFYFAKKTLVNVKKKCRLTIEMNVFFFQFGRLIEDVLLTANTENDVNWNPLMLFFCFLPSHGNYLDMLLFSRWVLGSSAANARQSIWLSKICLSKI